MVFIAVIEFPDDRALIRSIDSEDIHHAALVLRSMCREHTSVRSAFLCPKQICTPITLPKGDQP
jgi:hypothetical protein